MADTDLPRAPETPLAPAVAHESDAPRPPETAYAPPAPHAAPHANYVLVWVGLAALTAIELVVAFLPWPKGVIIALLLGMAIWKACLVALYYMHLRFEPNRLRILAVAPLPLAVILVVAVTREYVW